MRVHLWVAALLLLFVLGVIIVLFVLVTRRSCHNPGPNHPANRGLVR